MGGGCISVLTLIKRQAVRLFDKAKTIKRKYYIQEEKKTNKYLIIRAKQIGKCTNNVFQNLLWWKNMIAIHIITLLCQNLFS